MLEHQTEILQDTLEKARLRYISADQKGITRQRKGEAFIYLDAKGKHIADAALLDWIASLGIPPAWQEVWISPYKNGHILATGRDSRGRKQYRYHPRWQQTRGETKFDRMAAFAQCLPTIRQTVAEQLRQRSLTKEKVLAIVITLLEKTLIRIGNMEYARHNESYGLTTLQDEHVAVENNRVQFEFVGKSGIEHTIELQDKRLARAIKACQELPGQQLFQYRAEDGSVQSIGSSDVNQYLYEITGSDFSAKTFRTWGASTRAIRLLCDLPPVETQKEREKQVREVIQQTAQELGNTVAICKKYYIHPLILQAHLDDHLREIVAAQPAPASPDELTREEAAFKQLIEGK